MNARIPRILTVAAVALAILGLAPLAAGSAARQGDDTLKRQFVRFLEGGGESAALTPSQSLYPLRAYPVTATTAFILLENDPLVLKEHYAVISRAVMQLFDEGNLAGDLVRGMPGAPRKGGSILSPGLNSLAALELYSLHLVAWKTGAYEDALECLAWSRSLSDAVTRGFYDPDRTCFFPVDADGRFILDYRPGQLLPLVLDRSLGRFARGRIAAAYFEASDGAAPEKAADPGDPWSDPSMRFMMLDLLAAAVQEDGALFSSLRAEAAGSRPEPSPWIEYWRENNAAARRLFPAWSTISPLVNLMLLFERDGLVPPKELDGLRAGTDSIAAALSAETMTVESYEHAIGVVNRMLTKLSRFSELLDATKESWRVMDGAKWRRLSPRAKRLISGTLAGAGADLASAKADLSLRLERECGIAFNLGLPAKPVPRGSPIDFSASLRSTRDAMTVSRFYLRIGDRRWQLTESSDTFALAPNGEPFVHRGSIPLPAGSEPGIVTLAAALEFLHDGKMVEIRNVESVAVTKEADAVLDFPDGRRIGGKPLRISLGVVSRAGRDVQGTVDGTILREFTTNPPLPARFLARADTERTDLTIEMIPKGAISPGRYPFSLSVALDGKPVARFKDFLVRPFNWLHLGTLGKRDEPLRDGISFQQDLFKSYASSDGRELHWQEVPTGTIDGEGALRPHRLYGKSPGCCALFYTVVEAPGRLKLVWRLATRNAFSLWINGEPVVPETEEQLEGASGAVELRKGPNSVLIAVCWDESPGAVSFELEDESGIPAAGLDNDLAGIIDGYERINVAQSVKKKGSPARAEDLKDVRIEYSNARATEVSIIGSFNNWEAGTTPMKKGAQGVWTVTLHLRAGRYPYKILVNRKQKITDPMNEATEPDGFGGTNSILEVK